MAAADRSSSETTAVPPLEEGAAPFVSCSLNKNSKAMSQSSYGHGSDSTCSDPATGCAEGGKPAAQVCTCSPCLQHNRATKAGDSGLEEFMRRSALYRINASIPQRAGRP